MGVSRDYYDETKNWVEAQWQEGVPVMDADLNVAQRIRQMWIRRVITQLIGNGSPNDGFLLSGSSTDPTIHAGDIYVTGLRIALDDDIAASWQPNAPVTFPSGDGIWCLDIEVVLISNVEDPVLRDSRLPGNVETPIKMWKADWTLRKEMDTYPPLPPPTHIYIGIARETGGIFTDIRNAGIIVAGSETGFQGMEGGHSGSGHTHRDEDIEVDSPEFTGDNLEDVLGEIDSRIGVVEGDVGVVTPHAGTHESGGSDPVNIANLLGQCTQPQISPAHTGIHNTSFNNGLAVTPDVNGNATLGAHLGDAAIHRRNHNDMESMQGGVPGERYHLGLDHYDAAMGAAGANAGNPFATIGDIAGVTAKFASPVQTVQELRDVPAVDRSDKQVRLVENKGALYRFDETGTGADDGDGIIAPSSGSGRWFRISSAVPDLSTVLAKGNNAGGIRITGLPNPSGDSDAATMDWVLGKIGAGGGTAETAWVVMDPTGAPGTYQSLQNAVDALGSSGGCIWVKPGTYTIDASIDMKSNVRVIGLGWNAELLVYPAVKFVPAAGFHGVMIYAHPANRFEGIYIEVPAGGTGIVPWRYVGSRVECEGCVFEGPEEYTALGQKSIGIGGEYGLYGVQIDSGRIMNNVFKNLTHAIMAEVNNSYIQGNIFSDGRKKLPAEDVLFTSINQGWNTARLTNSFIDNENIVTGMGLSFDDGTNSDSHTITDLTYDSINGYWTATFNGSWDHDFSDSPGTYCKIATADADITLGDNTYESYVIFNFFHGSGNAKRLTIFGDYSEASSIGLLSAYIIGNISDFRKSGQYIQDTTTILLEMSPYTSWGYWSNTIISNNVLNGKLTVTGDSDNPLQCTGNVLEDVDMTGFEGRVVFGTNLVLGDVLLKNAATVNGNYVTGALQVISGTTEKTLTTGNYVGQGMTLSGDYSAAVGNVIANGGLNVGGKGSRASSNSITGTLSLGFWGSATGNVIVTQKAMAISATVPRAQIVGNITMDEFYVVPLTASGTSATFDGTDADNFNIGDSVTFQSSKNIETRMISGKSGNMISWDAALNSTYDGEKAFTCLAHLEGLSSLSVITGNFVAGDVNVVGGTNLSCDFVGSSCVVSGNRILGVVVINENGRKNCVTGNVITAPVAATDYPKTWPFSSYPPDPSNVIASNVVDGSVI